MVRLIVVVTAVLACLWTIKTAATFGVSRLFVRYALSEQDPRVSNATLRLQAANEAVKLTPADAEAHFASAAVSALIKPPQNSLTEMEKAVAARPADYTLWMQLGLVRDQNGDQNGALAAFDESRQRAPFYAKPLWLRGNLLLRAGEYDMAFNDLRAAAHSDPELVPSLIDLAWGLSRNDPKLTEQMAGINTSKARLAFAKFLAKHGRPKEALEQYRAEGTVPSDFSAELLNQLLAKEAYEEAFEIWKVDHQTTGPPNAPQIYDGGFEGSLSFEDTGFGWRVPRVLQATKLSLDSSSAQSGAQSLRVEFEGDSNPGAILFAQLILLEPGKTYKVNFAARSQELVTGGPPIMVVHDASSDQRVLGRSPALSKGTTGWEPISFVFTTLPTTRAGLLSLRREGCTTSPCPIFGTLLIDSFSIERLN